MDIRKVITYSILCNWENDFKATNESYIVDKMEFSLFTSSGKFRKRDCLMEMRKKAQNDNITVQ